MRTGFCSEKLEKRALARLDVNGNKILKRALKIRDGTVWTRMFLGPCIMILTLRHLPT